MRPSLIFDLEISVLKCSVMLALVLLFDQVVDFLD